MNDKTPQILDGRPLKEAICNVLSSKISEKISVSSLKILPTLVIIRIGNNEASKTYVKNKIAFGKKIGGEVIEECHDENVTTNEIVHSIQIHNTNNSVHGVIVQMPIPVHLNQNEILNAIDSKKDVDGLGESSMYNLLVGKPSFIAATVKGILTMCREYNIELESKKVLVIGRSLIVGKPLALALINANATVTVAHSHTNNLKELVAQNEIIMIAAGKQNLVSKEMVHENQIIFDIGINRLEDDQLIGDFSADARKHVKAYTPVPGGVGQLTVASLFENLVEAYLKNS